jgi:hypothetical protein
MEKNLLTVKRKICLPQVEKSVYRGKKKLFTLPGKFCLTFRVGNRKLHSADECDDYLDAPGIE